MIANNLNYPSPIQTFQTLKKHIPLPSIYQKKIMLIAASIILGGIAIALCYTLSLIIKKFHLLRKNSVLNSNISTILIRDSNPTAIQNQLAETNDYIPQVPVFSPGDCNEKSFKENISLYANTLFKNATSLEDARVIVIGENHSISEHWKLEGIILKYFGKEDDILLVEGLLKEEKEVADPTVFFPHELEKSIPKKIHAFGWEKDLETLNSQIKMIKELPSYVQKFEDSSNDTEKIKLEKELLELEGKIFVENRKRNNFLTSLIKESMDKYPDSKVFVIAGSCHVLHKKDYDYSHFSLKGSSPITWYANTFDFNILEHLPPETRAAAVILKNEPPPLPLE